ncbi:glycosyltransferase family 4 protein [Desulfovibrionales bacterium]
MSHNIAQHHAPGSIWGTLDPFVESGPLLGRKVANRGFLQALFSTNPFREYHFFLADQEAGKALHLWLTQAFPTLDESVRIFPRTALPQAMATYPYHCFHLSDCLTHQGWLAAVRNKCAPQCFPITGVTHSLSYARFGTAFAQHVWPGTTVRDCIVATSRAGKHTVQQELAALQQVMPQAQIPYVTRVPLGIWYHEFACLSDARFAPSDLPDLREELDPRAVVFLVPGRISPYSKMDILPLLRAFQRLSRAGISLDAICLVLAGGTQESQDVLGTLRALAANIGLQLKIFPSPTDTMHKALLRRADAVISLADNPQETFGLTVLEAQAAGKPVLVSDYDGYRDLVVDKKSGFLIPTLDGGNSALTSLMAPLLYDTTYHLWLAQDVAVDVGAVALALKELMDPCVRQRMGQAACEHTRSFDWPRVLRCYEELWAELWTRGVPESRVWQHPLAIQYESVFADYPTTRLDVRDILHCTELGWAVLRKQDFPVLYAGLEERIAVHLVPAILVWTRHGLSWAALQERVEASDREYLGSTVLWMLKGDLLTWERGRP